MDPPPDSTRSTRSELLDVVAGFTTEESHSVRLSSHITADPERIADHLAVP